MPWNSTTKKMTAPVSMDDMCQAFGYYGENVVQYAGAHGLINPFAKYKPIKYPKLGPLTDAERRSQRYGYGGTWSVPTLGGNFAGKWTYQYPGAGDVVNEPNCLLHLVKGITGTDRNYGYFGKAPCPFKMDVEVTKGGESYTVGTGSVSAIMSFNAAVSSLWNGNDCMAFRNFIDTGAWWTDYVFAFVIRNLTKGLTNFVVTNKSPSQVILSEDQGQWFFSFSQIETYPGDGTVNPAIPALNQASLGDSFQVIACMVYRESMLTTDNYVNNYNVYTSSTSPTWERAYNAYSLNFANDCDRANTTCKGMWSIENATGSITSFSTVDDGVKQMKNNGEVLSTLQGRKFIPTIMASIDTTNCPDWTMASALHRLSVDLIIRLEITNITQAGGAYSYDDDLAHSSYYPGSNGNIVEWRKTILLGSQTTGNYTLTPLISPNRTVPGTPSQYITDPDNIYVLNAYTTVSSITLVATAFLKYGDEEVQLGSSQPVTLTF